MNKKEKLIEIEAEKKLKTLMREGEELISFLVGKLATGNTFFSITYIVGISSQNLYFIPYKNGMTKIKESSKAYNPFILSNEFIKKIKFEPAFSKLAIFFEKDKIAFTLYGKHWKKKAKEFSVISFENEIGVLTDTEFLENIEILDKELGFLKSILDAIEKYRKDTPQVIEIFKRYKNRVLSQKVAASYLFSDVLLTIGILIFASYSIEFLFNKLVFIIFNILIGVSLWRLNSKGKQLIIIFASVSILFSIIGILADGFQLGLIFQMVYSGAIFITIIGTPSRKRILFGALIFYIGYLGVNIFIIVNYFLSLN